jgi:hypothetical protein
MGLDLLRLRPGTGRGSAGMSGLRCALWFLGAALLAACDGSGLGPAFEFDERSRLVRSVEAVIDAQERTLDEFRAALRGFDAVFYDLSQPLGDRYGALETAYRRIARNADRVHDRIGAVSRECDRLFRRWAEDIPVLRNNAYRVSRQVHLERSRTRCERVLVTLRATDGRLQPLLERYRDELVSLRRDFTETRFLQAARRFRAFHRDMQTTEFALRDSISSASDFITLLEEALLEAPT